MCMEFDPPRSPRYLGRSKLIFQMLLCFWRTPGQPSHHQACHGVVKVNLRSTHKQHADLYIRGGFTQFEKYARQNGNLPQIGVKIKNIWNHQSVCVCVYVPPFDKKGEKKYTHSKKAFATCYVLVFSFGLMFILTTSCCGFLKLSFGR